MNTEKITETALTIIDQLDRLAAVLSVTAEVTGLDADVSTTLGVCVIDLIPTIKDTAFQLIEDADRHQT